MELGDKEFWTRLEKGPAQLAAEIASIDVVNLDQTLQQHASLRAWVNATHEAAIIEVEVAEYEVTKSRARALLKAKEDLDPTTGKHKVGDVLKAEVEGNAEVIEREQVAHAARVKRGVLRAMSNSLEDRKDMLIQISAKQRQERRDY